MLKGVYLFNAASQNRPIASLVAGLAGVTDGLVLRITTEGIFVDDDVATYSHREWDIKAWTIRLIEVFCPRYTPPPRPAAASDGGPKGTMRKMFGGQDKPQPRTPEEMDAITDSFDRVCRTQCKAQARAQSRTAAAGQPQGGQHMLRASIRDADGRRYVFVTDEDQAWKIAASVRRIRLGSQARQLAVDAMGTAEACLVFTTLR